VWIYAAGGAPFEERELVVDGEGRGELVRGGGTMVTFAEPGGHWASWGEWTNLFCVQEDGSTHEVKHIGIQPQMVVTGYGHSGEITFHAVGHEGAGFASWSSTVSNAPQGSGSSYTLPISSNTPPGVYIVTGHGELGCDHVATVIVIRVGMTAYRPTTEGPAYGIPFDKHEVPEDLEETPGAGIRVNGDTESGTNENDLIEVELNAEPYPTPSGLTYVLKRQNSNIKVWDSQTMGTAILDSGTEATITFSAATKTVWVENPSGGSADLEFIARSGTTDVCKDKVHFYPFTSIVIALGGETQNPSDPADPNNGIYQLAIDLYNQGYDVHMYDEDAVDYGGAGATYNEVVNAVQHRGVSQVAVYGYSHGGGSTFLLVNLLNNNRGAIGTFTIPFTAYIDAVEDEFMGDMNQEHRRPPSSAFHVNYYQEGVANPLSPWFDYGLDGGPIGDPAPGDPAGVNVDAGGQTIRHGEIDEHGPAINAIRNGIMLVPK